MTIPTKVLTVKRKICQRDQQMHIRKYTSNAVYFKYNSLYYAL